jgi:tetratricopeptide (TPR) repeat protein
LEQEDLIMEEFARRLMLQGHRAASNLPTAIFGTAAGLSTILELNKPRLRVGVWPFISAEDPQTAMGLAALLALLLDRYRDVRVYRLFAQVEGEPDAYAWEIGKSQFGVDDWQLDDLDENIAIWGKLTQPDGKYQLEISVENDLLDEDDSLKSFVYSGATLGELAKQISKAAGDIAEFIDAQDFKLIAPIYTDEDWNDFNLQELLKKVFDWERNLYLAIWGRAWDTLNTDQKALVQAGRPLSEFGAWVVSRCVARAIIITPQEVSEAATLLINDTLTAFPDQLFPAIYLGGALYETSEAQEAYELIEGAIQEHDDDSALYLALGELYRVGGRPGDALSLYQEAVQSDVVNADIYMRYADLVLAMDYNNMLIEDFVMIDPDEITHERMTYEAIEAYQAVLDEDPNHLEALYRQLSQFLELGEIDERFWPGFKHLVNLDQTGERVRGLLDIIYNLDDLSPAFQILKDATVAQPERYDIPLNIAVAYLADEDGDGAITYLQRARQLTADENVHGDIDRLTLSAENPDFEMRLGEITDVVSAGNTLSSEDVELLEEAVEKAPSFAEGYVLLGKAYVGWKEPGTAIETLLDGHKHLPDDPDIAVLLAQTLWESGEHASAFGYLNKALEKNPTHVPLLAVTGRYLFEDGQEDAAKAYLTRAELIAPNHPVLQEVRVFISSMLD